MLMDNWFVSIWGYYKSHCYHIFCIFWWIYVHIFLSFICVGVELLGDRICIHSFTFGRLSQFILPSKSYESPASVQILASASYYWPFHYSNSIKCALASHCGLFCIFKMSSKITHLFMCVAIRQSLLWSALNNFCPFYWVLYIFLINFQYYVLWKWVLCWIYMVNIFLSCGLPSYSLTASSEQKLLMFLKLSSLK